MLSLRWQRAIVGSFNARHGVPQSNDSLEPTGRPTALPRPELRPGRPAAQFRRYVDMNGINESLPIARSAKLCLDSAHEL
jgi:hypothetical protein